MEENTIYFVFPSLGLKRGGLTKSVIKRANLLSVRGVKVCFLTTSYQPDFEIILKKMRAKNVIHKKIDVKNFYNDIASSKSFFSLSQYLKRKKNNVLDFLYEKIGSQVCCKDRGRAGNAYRIYRNGVYKEYRCLDSTGKLKFIDFMSQGRERIERVEYDFFGAPRKSIYMSTVYNTPRLERYLDCKGKCFASHWVETSEKGVVRDKRIVVLAKNKKNWFGKEFSSLVEAVQTWVSSFENESSCFVSDSRKTDVYLDNVEPKRKIAVLHNSHLAFPYDDKEKVKKNYLELFEKIKDFRSFVVLTEAQKLDIEWLGFNVANFYVVPHSFARSKKNYEKDGCLIVSVARLESQKKLSDAIKAFDLIAKKIPLAQYHIYGVGNEKDNLESLIYELNLEEKVILKGYTENAEKVLGEARCSLLTSEFEGWGLSVMESLAVGTPVVSYDVRYGPSDMIKNNENGFLIKKGDYESLAQKVIEIIESQDLFSRLSENAGTSIERYSEESFTQSWMKIIKSILNEEG